MKVVVSVDMLGADNIELYLDKDCFCVKKNKETVRIECDKEERINTLISLFSLKHNWNNELDRGRYSLSFYNSKKVETFFFDNKLPDNWLLFCSTLARLAGEIV